MKFVRRFRNHAFIYILLLAASNFIQNTDFVRYEMYSALSPSQELSHAYVELTGEKIKIAYREAGKGIPVLFIHGSPGSSENFSRMVSLFSKDFRAIAVDLPGYGGSSEWVDDYGLENNSRMLLKFMDSLSLTKFHIVGYSFGSGIALHMARSAPEKVISLSLYGGIGIQETEGSGDYYLEHIKYGMGYAAFVILPEIIPHFGLFGPRGFRHAFIRNFWDSDQRKISEFISSIGSAVLIVHALDDSLVHSFAAREHHRLLKNSILKMLPSGNHFMPFTEEGSRELFRIIAPFMHDVFAKKHITRATYDLVEKQSLTPVHLDIMRFSPWKTIFAIITATFVSEDLTCITGGLLVRERRMDIFVAVLGCFTGIFLGDIGLWLIGRFLSSALGRTSWFKNSRFNPVNNKMGSWFNENTGKIIFTSRFIPGTRFVTYVGAGYAKSGAGKFMFWALLAGLLWSPVLIFLSAAFGSVLTDRLIKVFGSGWISFLISAVLLYTLIRIFIYNLTQNGRTRSKKYAADIIRQITASIKLIIPAKKMIGERKNIFAYIKIHCRNPIIYAELYLKRYFYREFMPSWIFYLPVFFYLIYLTVKYKSFTLFTASNPGIIHSGVVGESKSEILSRLNQSYVMPFFRVNAYDNGFDRTANSIEHKKALYADALYRMGDYKFCFPVIAKPDMGERGRGVKLLRNKDELFNYTEIADYDFILQKYHPGPHEAGILYYRYPGEKKGRIYSVTDKVFPKITGDGISTLENLILNHPRYRFQHYVFSKRFSETMTAIPEAGERIGLAAAGNHCQGTMFLDGKFMITEALERKIDSIVKNFEGFHIGRFDVRYSDRKSFMDGKKFKIIELNGVLGESTNIYDPSFSFIKALKIYACHLDLIYKIGEMNREKGAVPSGVFRLTCDIIRYYKNQKTSPVSD